MRRHVSFAAALPVVATLVAPGVAAAALPPWLDPFARLEAGAAVPLRQPQTDYFTPGFGGKLSLGLTFLGTLGVQLTGQPVVLPARDTAPTNEPGVPVGLGGGLRLQLPYRFAASPWIDGDALYVRTGSYDRFGFAVGAGLDFGLGASRAVRLGPFVRFVDVLDQSADAASAHKVKADALMFIAGLSLEVGRPHQRIADRDGDGSADADDRCPDDPGLPATFGCPDRDADGVVDALDRCVEAPGPPVLFGCPDGDKDGIVDKEDRCPKVPGPARFAGCPDRDGDLIADVDDKCPTQPGAARAGGCPDRDDDTVGDPHDKCPDVAGSPAAGGCPDRDGDTVADLLDRCPDLRGSAAANGCLDSDGDGVEDPRDRCPDRKGRVVTEGCPDGDADGIADSEDQCPEVAGSMLAKGCPDRDGDRIADATDQCPDVRGPEDNAGCPRLAKVIDKTVAQLAQTELEERVYFDYKSSEVETTYEKTLAAVAQVLARYPEARISLEGHADDRGSDHYNVALSRERAYTVRGYLLAHGVPAERLLTRGWGARRPAVRDTTPEARDRNRRVEFVLVP